MLLCVGVEGVLRWMRGRFRMTILGGARAGYLLALGITALQKKKKGRYIARDIPRRPHSSRSLASILFHLPLVSSSAIWACTSPSMVSSPQASLPLPAPPPPPLAVFPGGDGKPSIWNSHRVTLSRSA